MDSEGKNDLAIGHRPIASPSGDDIYTTVIQDNSIKFFYPSPEDPSYRNWDYFHNVCKLVLEMVAEAFREGIYFANRIAN